MKVNAIVPAAGLGVRMAGGKSAQGVAPPKQLLELEGVPILLWTLRRLAASPRVDRIIVALRAEDRARVEELLGSEDYRDRIVLVDGGESRQDSVANALSHVEDASEMVLVHDAVRPFLTAEQIERVITVAGETGAAILGLPATDTVKQVDPATGGQASRVHSTLPRERIVLAQTPQVFRTAILRDAIARATEDGFRASDESMLVEHSGVEVAVVMGSERNIKITRPGDLELAGHLMKTSED